MVAKKKQDRNSSAAAASHVPANEFGGPLGTVAVVFGLPILTMYMLTCIQHNGGALIVPSCKEDVIFILERFPRPTYQAAGLYLGWFALQALLQIFAPGPLVKGVPLSNGERLVYKMNGWTALLCVLALCGAALYLGVPGSLLFRELGPLMAVANLFAFALAIALYAGHRVGAFGLRLEKCSGNAWYDFFMGGSVNPRVGSFDIKCFCESRPGLMLWLLLNLSAVAAQLEQQGHVSSALLLVTGFHSWYVVDYFWQEDAILTTMDIMHDKFGWMLCWGDLAWVPFVYTLQAQYLLQHPEVEMSPAYAALVLAVNGVGYYIFRSSNGQKNEFRTIPGTKIWGKVPDKVDGYIQTARGTRLLCCGWWGLSRHPNYLGDWLMGLAWCLPCGFAQGHVLPYFYAIYFAVLLLHREQRDAEHCAAKYGKDWVAYCERVPYKIIPYIY